MKKSKAIILVSAGLIAGLILGTVGLASAATEGTEPANPVAGYCQRLGGAMRDAGGRLVDIVADLTGLSTDEVIDQRHDGKSIADIAESAGVSSNEVVEAALEARKAFLDERVADGTLDAEDAAAMLEQMEERLSERITSTEVGPPEWSGGQGRGMGGQGGGQYGGGACGACPYGAAQ